MYKGGTIVAITIKIGGGTWRRVSFREKKKVRFYWSVFKIEIKLAEYFLSGGGEWETNSGRVIRIYPSQPTFFSR